MHARAAVYGTERGAHRSRAQVLLLYVLLKREVFIFASDDNSV